MDFTVVAIVKGAAAPYESAGVVAEAAEIKKVKQYEARYAGVRIVGFGVEISGAFGPAAKRFTWKTWSRSATGASARPCRSPSKRRATTTTCASSPRA